MHEERIAEFLQWLPSKFQEFQNLSLEEISTTLNQLAQTEEGAQTIETLWNTFNEENSNVESTTMFKQGGKLDYLVQLHKKGGKTKTCSCGCTLHKVFKDGGIIEKCACGCKNKVQKKQEGGSLQPCKKPDLKTILKQDVAFGMFNQFQDGGQIDNSRGQSVGRLSAFLGKTNYRTEPGYGKSTEYQTPNGDITQILVKDVPYGSGALQTSRTITTDKQGMPADTTYRRPDGKTITKKNQSEYNRLTGAFSRYFPQGVNNFKKK